MRAWEHVAEARAPDGTLLELHRRGDEFLILAGGYDLMSSEDAVSSCALAELGCAHLSRADAARVLIGGLGMGFTAQAALLASGPQARIEIAELVPAVVEWNRATLAVLTNHPLDDARVELLLGDVSDVIRDARGSYDAILLDVDNGPDSLAHAANDRLYDHAGIVAVRCALRPGGVLAVWSYSDDASYTRRLRAAGFEVSVVRVAASRKGRGRRHYIWLATAPAGHGR
jgi:spermidine synthase